MGTKQYTPTNHQITKKLESIYLESKRESEIMTKHSKEMINYWQNPSLDVSNFKNAKTVVKAKITFWEEQFYLAHQKLSIFNELSTDNKLKYNSQNFLKNPIFETERVTFRNWSNNAKETDFTFKPNFKIKKLIAN